MNEQPKEGRILIVDDVPQNIQVLGTLLEQEGYSISIAQNGLQALEITGRSAPDLILLDIMMPELDGFETCKRLKENSETRDILVVFLTARTELEDVIKGFELGAVDYITKPFYSLEVLVRVNTHLTLRELQKDLERLVEERTSRLAEAHEKLLEAYKELERQVKELGGRDS